MKTEAPPEDEAIKGGPKRPDVTARHNLRKTLVEQCVKCSLPGRLAPDWPPILRAILIDNLERQIRSTSEIIVRGSLLVNDVLHHCLRLHLPMPALTQSFFNACFLQGLKKTSKVSKSDFTIVKDVFENEFHEYPFIERTRGDTQAITIVAARYGTNLKTSVKQSFLTRQKAFVRFWLQYHGLESEEVSAYHVQCLINGWVRPPVQRKRKRKIDGEGDSQEIPPEVLAFVKQERQLLDNPGDFAITDRTSVECLLLPYLYHILEFYRVYGDSAATRSNNVGPVLCSVVERRTFPVAPWELPHSSSIRGSLVTTTIAIPTPTLMEVDEEGGEEVKGKTALPRASSRGFSIAPVCKIKRHFMTIDTTVLFELLKNVAAEADPKLCPDWLAALGKMSIVEFRKKENEYLQKTAWDATFNIDGLRKRRTFGRQIDTDGVSMTVHFSVTKRKRARHQKRIQRQPDTYKRIVAIDPGRVNLVTALDSSTHKIRTLTRKEYYSNARINRLNKMTSLWEIPLRGVVSALSKTCIRTSSPSLTYAYRQVIVRNYDFLWGLRFQKKRAREALVCYAGKQRVMDTFFSSFTTRGEEKPVIAYGASSFRPTGKGEISVPVKGVLKACRKHYRTQLVNEYLTTKVHHACGHRLNPIASRMAGPPVRAIRGLCWCNTCTKFVSRDGNAARNILRVFKTDVRGQDRPHDLRYGQRRQVTQTLLKLP